MYVKVEGKLVVAGFGIWKGNVDGVVVGGPVVEKISPRLRLDELEVVDDDADVVSVDVLVLENMELEAVVTELVDNE